MITSSVVIGVSSGLVVSADYNLMLLLSHSHGQGQYTAMKGALGEGIMDDFYTGKGKWCRLDAAKVSRLGDGSLILQKLGGKGQTGLDGIYIRYNTRGNPIKIMVSEAKAFESKLRRNPKTGAVQFDAKYRSDRLGLTAQRYKEASQQIRQGKVLQLNRVPRDTKGISNIRAGKNQSISFWYNAKSGKWNYMGNATPEEVARSLSKLNRLLISTEHQARVFRFDINKQDVVTIRSINHKTGNERIIQKNYQNLLGEDKIMVKNNLINSIADDLHRNGFLDAEIRAKTMVNQAEKENTLGTLAKNYRPQQRYSPAIGMRPALRGARTGAVLVALIDGISQLLSNDEFDVTQFTTMTFLGGTSAFLGGYSGTQAQYFLGSPPAQQLMNRTSKIITGKAISNGTGTIASKFGGVFLKGTVASAVFSYGMYFCGMTDLKTANRSTIAGCSGVIAGALYESAVTALITTYGTASTGVAISSLSGAAATSATTAWIGGGSAVAGGIAGSIISTAGTSIIVIAVGSGIMYGFHVKDEHTKRDVTKSIVDSAVKYYENISN